MQINYLDAKLTQSIRKVVTESKFRDFINNYEDLKASKLRFELIISSFSSNSTLLVVELDKFIDNHQNMAPDVKLVNSLDSGAGIFTSLVEDLITFSRSHNEMNFDASGSSTMTTVFDIYITTLIAVLKSNAIQEFAVNLKTAITGNNYELNRLFNHNHKNEVLKALFSSLHKKLALFNDRDTIGFIDLTNSENSDQVQMKNVLQFFWSNEHILYDECNVKCKSEASSVINKVGCSGRILNCIPYSNYFTNQHVSQSLQIPQVDRIYNGYRIGDGEWHGKNGEINARVSESSKSDVSSKASVSQTFSSKGTLIAILNDPLKL